MSWRGWRKQYGRDKQNYFVTDIIDANNSASVQSLLRTLSVNEKYRHIKNIVVDGISTLMIKEEFRRRNEKGYDKYQDLAAYIYETADLGNKLRDDLTVIFIGHVDSDRDVNGNEVFAQVKTSGQKLKKIVLESLFTTVLYCKHDGDDFVFETVSNNSTAKSPMDALPAVDVYALWTSGSILTASNEGYDVDPFDPGFSSPILPIEDLFGGLL